MTPYKYVMDHRLQRSVEYLKTNKYSITEITSLTGFNQVTHFIQVFKRKYGKTPKEYQKN
ncbi:helix-turn-helix domain-containing protein [Paenibacillus sp. MER TA 81-3]